MEGSPWLFRGAAIVLEEYDGFSNVLDYKLNRIPVWTTSTKKHYAGGEI